MRKIDELIEIYEDFTNDISTKHWRVSGHQISELKHFRNDISLFTPITNNEKDLEWVKKERHK